MLGMSAAVDRINQAIARNERILIYGDYDVDGTTSVVLLTKVLGLLGAQHEYYVPHRLREGYGMREDIVDSAADRGVRLIISVDTGIREHDAVARARELGVDVIITDHHLPDDSVPDAFAVVDPNQPGCPYPDKNLCGVGLAFKLAHALLRDRDWPENKRERLLRSLLKIVALGTIADLVPLSGENRVIAALGLGELRQPVNPGLQALLSVAGVRPGHAVDASAIAFRVGPRINAAGRMDAAAEVVELFTTQESGRADAIAQKLDGLNAERQATEARIYREICEQLQDIRPPSEQPFLVLAGEDWHAGVVGIVASRVVEKFRRPVLVLCKDTSAGTATGSARSIPAYHLLEGLESAAPLFERFGGHRQAAGCTLPIDRIDELRDKLNTHAAAHLKPADFQPILKIDAELGFSAIQDTTMDELSRLAPHGIGNPAPVFATRRATLVQPPRILKEKHLKLRLQHDGAPMSAIGWRMAEDAPPLDAGAQVDVAYVIEPDTYWGGWQLVLKDLRVAQ